MLCKKPPSKIVIRMTRKDMSLAFLQKVIQEESGARVRKRHIHLGMK